MPSAGKIHASAHAAARTESARTGASAVDRRPEAIAQRALVEGIHDGPFMTAQRAQVRGALGGDASAPAVGPLPEALRSGIESLSGVSMAGVKVHYGSPRPAELGAAAFARRNDIHLGPGQERHLPHEAWHVVQQARGRVQPTLRAAGGVSINDDPALEREADAMGERAARAPVGRWAAAAHGASPPGDVVQGNGLTGKLKNLAGKAASKLVGNTASDVATGLYGTVMSNASSVLGLTRDNAPWFGPLTGRGFGTLAECRITQARGPDSPDAENDTWNALKTRRKDNGPESYYIRGHLLNGKLHGPGDDWHNLTPLTRDTNDEHSRTVEEAVKDKVLHDPPVDYRVQAIYGRWPWQWPGYLANMLAVPVASKFLGNAYQPLVALKDAEQHIPTSLACDWWVGAKREHFSRKVAQKPNKGSGIWIDLGGGLQYDFSTSSAIWDLAEAAAAVAIKTALVPLLVPYLAASGTVGGILAVGVKATTATGLPGAVEEAAQGTAGVVSSTASAVAAWPRVAPIVSAVQETASAVLSSSQVAALTEALQSIGAVPLVRLVIDALGGKISAIVTKLTSVAWDAKAFVASLDPRILESVAEAASRLIVKNRLVLPSLGKKDPRLANKEAFDTIARMRPDERQVFNTVRGAPGKIGSYQDLHRRRAATVAGPAISAHAARDRSHSDSD